MFSPVAALVTKTFRFGLISLASFIISSIFTSMTSFKSILLITAISANLNNKGCLRMTHGPSVIDTITILFSTPKIKSEGQIKLPTFSMKSISTSFKSLKKS